MITVPPLCIIQARYASTRLPGKMLLELGGVTLMARAYRLACEAFSSDHVLFACPRGDRETPFGAELDRIGAAVEWSDAPETDVLTRCFVTAHRRRWHPDSVIVRWTPDDPFKDPALCRRVARGERLPVEQGGEAFTLAQLDRAQYTTQKDEAVREHLGNHRLLFPVAPPPPPAGVWTIDTPEDYAAAQQIVAGQPVVRAVVPGPEHPEVTT